MPSAHSVTLRLDEDGVHGTFHCVAGEGAECRMICPGPECQDEYGCTDRINHVKQDYGSCIWLEWLDSVGCWYETYGGDETVPRDGLINLKWSQDDETYLWSYEDAASC